MSDRVTYRRTYLTCEDDVVGYVLRGHGHVIVTDPDNKVARIGKRSKDAAVIQDFLDIVNPGSPYSGRDYNERLELDDEKRKVVRRLTPNGALMESE